jgi:hypothetical protein
MTLQPAYGRDYKSRAAVLVDLKAGKDFICARWEGFGRPGCPINLPQILAEPGGDINVRYSANRKVAVFKRSELE